jgi:hypothetical protein
MTMKKQSKAIEVYYAEDFTLSDEGAARIAKAVDKKLCCACLKPLKDAVTIKHCHENCYRSITRAIRNGSVDVKQVYIDGKFLAGKRGRPTRKLVDSKKPSN